ncbi:hypothetical protein ACKXGF_02850 [Alkalibacillus sp. S2W]|uniref:hypothetical protein n=1 Tax=Alkalibacillus sp. S2W TaxID=3386553 RepID=UPI00398CBA46
MEYDNLEEYEDDLYALIDDLERQNAIRLLPDMERKVLEYVEQSDLDMARASNDFEDYIALNQEAKPGERAAKHFGLSVEVIVEILDSATNNLRKLRK